MPCFFQPLNLSKFWLSIFKITWLCPPKQIVFIFHFLKLFSGYARMWEIKGWYHVVFSGGKSIVMKFYFVMLISYCFRTKFQGGSLWGGCPPASPVEESQASWRHRREAILWEFNTPGVLHKATTHFHLLTKYFQKKPVVLSKCGVIATEPTFKSSTMWIRPG